VSNTRELGLDEIHYLSLNALATLKIYLKIKGNLISQETSDLTVFNKNNSEKYFSKFVVDSSCPEIVLDILELNKFGFELMKAANYEGKKNLKVF
jgi:hypothetical protein